MSRIRAVGLSRTFTTFDRSRGLAGAVRDLFRTTSEERIAVRLMTEGRRDGQAIRFMTTVFGVYIDEILIRFPSVDRTTVKGWRKNESIVPDDIIEWSHAVVRAGGL